MKALIVTKTSERETPDTEAIRGCRASLQAMGITYNRYSIASGGTISAGVANSYDFIVIPYTNAGFDTMIDDANITVPVMCLNCASTNTSGLGTASGVDNTGRLGQAERWVDCTFTNEKFIAFNGFGANLTTGTAIMTVAALDALSGAAFTGAGKAVLWSGTRTGGNYFSAVRSKFGMMLPFLVQMAVDDGNLSASPRLAPVVVDLDHITGDDVGADPTIVDKIASYVPTGGIIWAGIHNTTTAFTAMSDASKAKLQQYSGAPFKYCWHDHSFNPIICSGTWPNETVNVNKTTELAKFDSDEAIWNGYGLEFHTPFYYNSGSNSFSDGSMELYQRRTDKASSPANDTSQAGKQAKVFRSITASERAAEARTSMFRNQHHVQRKFREILLVNTWDMELAGNMPYDAISDWVLNTRYLTNAISVGQSMYIHDDAFIPDEQDPGTTAKHHGYTVFQTIADTGAYLKDVCKPFADPMDYVA